MSDANDMSTGEEPTDANQTEMPLEKWSEPANQAMLPPQTHGQFGEAFPATQTAPGPEFVSGALFAEQAPATYPPTVAYPSNYAQPGYPQNMYQQPSMPLPLQPGQPGLFVAPPKRRTGLWIALIIVVVLLLGGGTALALAATQRPTNTPEQALQQFCDGYKTFNAQEVYDTLSSASKSGTSLAQLQQGFDEIKSLGSFMKITACKVSDVQQQSSTATGTITITDAVSFGNFSSSASVPMSMGLVLENNTWKVDITKMHSNITVPTFPPSFLTPTVPGSSNQ